MTAVACPWLQGSSPTGPWGATYNHPTLRSCSHLNTCSLAYHLCCAVLLRTLRSMGVDATCFHGYHSGVIRNCTSKGVDHAVLMVAAGASEAGVNYFTIKNSCEWRTSHSALRRSFCPTQLLLVLVLLLVATGVYLPLLTC